MCQWIIPQFNWIDQPSSSGTAINLPSQDVDRRCQERVLMGKDTAEEKVPAVDAGSKQKIH